MINFEDNFSAKIEVNEWVKTNMAPASYHTEILIPKYEQADKVKLLTPNHGLPFAIRWPNLNLNHLNPNIKIQILICYPYTFSIEVVGRIWWSIN